MMRMIAVVVSPILIAMLSGRAIDADVDASAVIESAWSQRDFELSLDPEGREWREAPRVTASRNYVGEPIAGPPTEIRSRWTNANLYLLYINPYDALNLKPDPTLSVRRRDCGTGTSPKRSSDRVPIASHATKSSRSPRRVNGWISTSTARTLRVRRG